MPKRAVKSVKDRVVAWCNATSSKGHRPTGSAAMRALNISVRVAYIHVNAWLADHPDIAATPDGRFRTTKDALKGRAA